MLQKGSKRKSKITLLFATFLQAKESEHGNKEREIGTILLELEQSTTLDLSRNNISDARVKALAVALPQLKQLTALDLNRNYIDDEGMKALAVITPA